jgi:hypothetical protein
MCAARFTVEVDKSDLREGIEIQCHCPNCATLVRLVAAESTIDVRGRNAEDVERVTVSLVKTLKTRSHSPEIRNPWITGSFYLASLVSVVTLLPALAKVVTPLLVPIVMVGAVLGVSVVGAFQLRHDQSLGEKNFLSLMALTFKQLPLVGKRTPADYRAKKLNQFGEK